MKKVVMTFATVDAAGKADGGSVDVEIGVDSKSTPANSVTRFKFALTPAAASAGPAEFRLTWSDSNQLQSVVNNILAANPVP